MGPRPLSKCFGLRRALLLRDHRELACLSASYARLRGTYQGVTNSFATNRPNADIAAEFFVPAAEIAISVWDQFNISFNVGTGSDRSTCMPYPRRQRSS